MQTLIDFDSWATVTTAIPCRRLSAFHALVADFLADETNSVDDAQDQDDDFALDSSTVTTKTTDSTPWTLQELQRIAGTEAVSIQRVAAVLDVLAEDSDRDYGMKELMQRLGLTQVEIRNALSKFTRHMRAYYPGHVWPMVWSWGPTLGPGHSAQQYYSLPADVAQLWRQARG